MTDEQLRQLFVDIAIIKNSTEKIPQKIDTICGRLSNLEAFNDRLRGGFWTATKLTIVGTATLTLVYTSISLLKMIGVC